MPRIVVSYIKEDRIAPYLAALRAVGVNDEEIFLATPMRVAEVDLDELMRSADGLLLTGGVDLQPALYGEARAPGVKLDPPAPDRDQMEWDLLSFARDARAPVFAICRGHQTLNVFLGGALFQDLPLQTGRTGHGLFPENGFALDHLAHELVPATTHHPLAAWLASFLRPLANSLHHQAVKRIGRGLELVATAPDGTVEATASPAGAPWWLRSVQWHPEHLMGHEVHRGLFEQFVAEARRFAGGRPVELRREEATVDV